MICIKPITLFAEFVFAITAVHEFPGEQDHLVEPIGSSKAFRHLVVRNSPYSVGINLDTITSHSSCKPEHKIDNNPKWWQVAQTYPHLAGTTLLTYLAKEK